MTPRPVILDLKVGNLASLANAFEFIGIEGLISNEPDAIRNASHIVLPGVGAFDAAMNEMDRLGLRSVIVEEVTSKNKPIIGICVGFQVLFESSEEGKAAGLGLLRGSLKLLPQNPDKGLKVPHTGFSNVQLDTDSDFFSGLSNEESFYFTHSFALVGSKFPFETGICNYGVPFAAAAKSQNIYGTQFHPEKSQSAGLRCLVNFFERTTQQ